LNIPFSSQYLLTFLLLYSFPPSVLKFFTLWSSNCLSKYFKKLTINSGASDLDCKVNIHIFLECTSIMVIKYLLLLMDGLNGPEISDWMVSNTSLASGSSPLCGVLFIFTILHSRHLGILILCCFK